MSGRLATTLVLIAAAAGCSSGPKAVESLHVPAGSYSAAFQAAKDVLRDFEFELDRVDAREGVITTAPRAWSGAATPWLPYTSQPRDAIEGLVQFEQRTARVEFRPADGSSHEGGDLRSYPGEIEADVTVTVERLYRPGRRVDATSVRLTGFTTDPQANPGKGPTPAFAVEQRKDAALAARIQEALEKSEPRGQADAGSPPP